jgi:hypothetical protein
MILRFDSSFRLTFPNRVVNDLTADSITLNSYSDRHLFLTVPAKDSEVILAGCLGEMAAGDLLSFFNVFCKTGVLRFSLAGGTKEIYFQQGEIVMAASTFQEDDIGEILYELGKVNRDVLENARNFSAGFSSLGKGLVEQEIISAKDLWQATRYQVEKITFSLFEFKQGGFSFLIKPLEEEEVAKLSMSTQNLIMEGLRRVDEKILFMRAIKSLDATPVFVENKAGLSTAEESMLQDIKNSNHSVRGVVRKSGAGEFDGLRFLYQLVQKGAVKIQIPEVAMPEGAFGDLLTIYNGAFSLLFKKIFEAAPHFIEDVNHFFHELPQPYSYVFRGIRLQDDGSLDGGKIVRNLDGLEEGDKLKLLSDALNEVLFMECEVARKELGSADASELIQRIQQISQRVKELIAKKND